ncbi:Dimerisation domain of Zinc Transporter [Glycomyces harbinensis]|uniref:Dimerisation domain of Zinc Transporter n=1 Tax=Glycomyces harbinensis TaxID=58114 RepID=A0A1G6QVV0_9ACTN|nr:Dimerisation domain of Zinc Transporter [Glycomyces harbinensis]
MTVDATPSVSEAHAIVAQVEYRLISEVSSLARATVHTDPHGSRDAHDLIAHHR